ncbi:hypothetical protein [Halorientalis halophila]|uniref:hypothetical protein n=1 Tax=Halorientalis halophila TaxID=3108499 RepID=UPI00300AC629
MAVESGGGNATSSADADYAITGAGEIVATDQSGDTGAIEDTGATGETDDAGEPRPTVDATVERVGATDALRYDLSITDLSALERVTLVVGRDATVIESEGLSVRKRGGRTWLRPADGADSATLGIRTTVSGADRPQGSGEFFATDEWVLGPVPLVELRWGTAGERERTLPLGDDLLGSSETTAGQRYALVGEQRTTTVSAADGQIRIVQPADTTTRAGSDELTAALAAAAERLDVGDRGDDVLLFALGSPARRGGESFPGRDEGWVHADAGLDDPNSVWFHEYVHTRQEFVLTDGMHWFREASAEYYAARLAYEQGRITESEMHTHLGGSAVHATLADPATWTDRSVPYTKGARVVWLLDEKIRLSTDGERSMVDVVRRLNEHDGPVSRGDFRDAVAAVAGHRMDGWIDRYVDNGVPVASFYPNEPARSGPFAAVLSLPVGARRAVSFLGVAVLLSGLVSVPLYRYLDRLEREDPPSRPV